MSQKTSVVDIAAGAGFTDIPSTMAARHVHIEEATNQAGTYAPGFLQVKEPDYLGAFSGFVEYASGASVELGNPIAEGNAFGTLLGMPMQNGGAAYVGGTTYGLNDVVVSAGLAYISIQAGNVGHTPASSPTFWTQVHNYTPATVYCKIRRTDGTAVKVLVVETP